jgi:hypothetical protein
LLTRHRGRPASYADALPKRFRGWIIVENDRPDLPVWESAVYSAAWMRMNLPGRERDRRSCHR